MFKTTSSHSSKISRYLKPSDKSEKNVNKARGDLPVQNGPKALDVLVTELGNLKTTRSLEQAKVKLPLLAKMDKKTDGKAPLAQSPLKSTLRAPNKDHSSLLAFFGISKKKQVRFASTDAVILHRNVESDGNNPAHTAEIAQDPVETQRITVKIEKVASKSEQLRARKVDFLESGIEKTPLRERNRPKRIFPANHKTNNPPQ